MRKAQAPRPGHKQIAPDLIILSRSRIAGVGLRAVLNRAGMTPVLVDGQSQGRLTELSPSDQAVVLILASQTSREDLATVVRAWPEVRSVLILDDEDPRLLWEALRAGAHGVVVCPQADLGPLLHAIERVRRGERTVCQRTLTHLIASFCQADSTLGAALLTTWERTVLAEMASGASNRQLAKQFNLSRGTIKNRMTVIYSKLGVRNRAQAIAKALVGRGAPQT